MAGPNYEYKDIINYLSANSGTFIKLQERTDSNEDLNVNKIIIFTKDTDKTLHAVSDFKKEISSKAVKQETKTDIGANIYYISSDDYNAIINKGITSGISLSKCELSGPLSNNKITEITNDKINMFLKGFKEWDLSKPDNNFFKNTTIQSKPQLTPEQQTKINAFVTDLQKEITEFNRLKTDKDKTRADYDNDTSDTGKKTTAEKTHNEALLQHELCKKLIDTYEKLLKELKSKNFSHAFTSITLPTF